MNFLNDDPDDFGIAVVDIYRMNEDGTAAEHWDVLQVMGDPKTDSAPTLVPNVSALNSNGVL